MKINLSSLNYFYIFLSIVWIPLQKSIFVIDGAGRSLIFFTIIISLLNFSNKKSRKLIYSKPIIFWGIWVIYSICNLYIKGYHQEDSIINFFLFQSKKNNTFFYYCVSDSFYIDTFGLRKYLV